MKLNKIGQGTKKILVGVSLLGLLGISNNVFSQDTEDSQNPKKMNPGVEIGRIINKETKGLKFGLYFSNPKIQIGYVVESNLKSKTSSIGKGIDLLKCGLELDYFPTNMEIIRPYVGSEIKYEHESLFVGRENEYYKKNGVGLEMKIGTEIKPLKERKLKLFFESGYNLSFGKESEGYPENPEVKRDKFITVVGLKF